MITTALEFRDALETVRYHGLDLATPVVLHEHSESIAETLCSLANMPEGGTVLFGLDPSPSFNAVGVFDPDVLQQTVDTLAQDAIEPSVRVQCYRAAIDDKSVLIVNVHGLPLAHRPCRVVETSKAYLRGLDGNYVLSAQEIHQLQTLATPRADDQAPVDGAALQHLDSERVDAFLRSAREDSEILRQHTADELLRMKGVLEPTGERPTLAGLYVLGRYPQQFFPNLAVTAVRRSSETLGQTVEPQRLEGPLPDLIENTVRWVVQQLRSPGEDTHEKNAYRASRLPIRAIREVVTNALIHRDLSAHSLGHPVQITVVDEVLSVRNPGGLWTISADQLGTAPAHSVVNEVLYEICRLTPANGGHRVVHPTKSTLKDVHSALRRAGMHAPRYIDSGLHFIVLLGQRIEVTDADRQWVTSLPQHETLTTAQRYLLILLSRGRHWDVQRLHHEFGPLDAEVVVDQLRGLVNRGLVFPPDTRSPSYRLADTRQRRDLQKPSITDFTPSHLGPAATLGADHEAEALAADEPTFDTREQRAAASSKHGATLWTVLQEGPKDIHALAEGAKLSLSQVRYAMQRLVAEGLVQRSGGQGHRETIYTQAS